MRYTVYEIRPIYFRSEYRIFHLNPARLSSEIKKGFCFV